MANTKDSKSHLFIKVILGPVILLPKLYISWSPVIVVFVILFWGSFCRVFFRMLPPLTTMLFDESIFFWESIFLFET